MSERIFTLFGEEIVPEQMKAVGKSRAKKGKSQEDGEDEAETTEDGAGETDVTDETENAGQQDSPEANQQPGKKQVSKAEKIPQNLPEDWQGEKQYYSIGEVADLFKVKTSHIRFWTNEFKLKVRTTRKGDRLFTPDQVKEIRAIHHLVKERGFTLTGAKAKLKAQNKMDVETIDLKQSLLQLRNKLVIIRNQLIS
ncbi:MAG: MerR family transcriptional regulator [Bacteroidota bacterium]